MTKRDPFDPAAILKAADDASAQEHQKLDGEVTALGGQIIGLVRDIFNRAAADDDQPVSVQIATAHKARDELQAMWDAATGRSSSGTPLTNEQKTLLELFDTGAIRLIQVDDPDNPGTKVPTVRENRDRLRQRRGQTPTPSTSQPPAQTTTSVPTPPPPATPATNQGTSGQGTTAPAVNPTTPAPTTNPRTAPAPASPPAQPPAPTSPPQPAPAAPATGSTQTNPGATGGSQTTPPPASSKGLLSGLTHLFEREPKSPNPTAH